MITLLQYPHPQNHPSVSPFCLKLETYFKVAGVPYQNKLTVNTGQTKRKKLPVIVDQGEMIEDSTLIIQHLKNKHGIDLDKNLTDEQRALTTAYKLVCEKSLVDIIMYFRWVDKNNWPKFREVIFGNAPWLVKATFANAASRRVNKILYGHGMGRFSDAEIIEFLHEDLKSISTYLSSKKYFFGEQPSSIDCTLFGHLAQLDRDRVVPQFKGILKQYPNLQIYVDNMFKLYWPQCN